MPVRTIIQIDETRCTGCGQCVIDCAEGALKIIDGKAKVVKDSYCDGLGACLGSCPEDALTLIDREADDFDEEAAMAHVEAQKKADVEDMACGCPGSMLRVFDAPQGQIAVAATTPEGKSSITVHPLASALGQWPVQLRLLPPGGSLYKDKNLVLVADCVAVAFPDLHRKLIAGNTIAVTCPKLDDPQDTQTRLAAIFQNPIRSLTCAIMEVPCCGGLLRLSEEAWKQAGRKEPFNYIQISTQGEILREGCYKVD